MPRKTPADRVQFRGSLLVMLGLVGAGGSFFAGVSNGFEPAYVVSILLGLAVAALAWREMRKHRGGAG